jgi:parallel beta-helix repeat protein
MIRNNVLTRNRADGIRIYSASPTIANNTIAWNGRNGIMVHGESKPTIINNIIACNTNTWIGTCEYGWGLYASHEAVIQSTFNDVWSHNNDYGTDTGGSAGPGAGDISLDPRFVHFSLGDFMDDFHLSHDSPCIDAGADIGFDFKGAAPDLGAFEYAK